MVASIRNRAEFSIFERYRDSWWENAWWADELAPTYSSNPANWAYSPRTGKSPLEREYVVAVAVRVEPVSATTQRRRSGF
jgi:hypothetical protein